MVDRPRPRNRLWRAAPPAEGCFAGTNAGTTDWTATAPNEHEERIGLGAPIGNLGLICARLRRLDKRAMMSGNVRADDLTEVVRYALETTRAATICLSTTR